MYVEGNTLFSILKTFKFQIMSEAFDFYCRATAADGDHLAQ